MQRKRFVFLLFCILIILTLNEGKSQCDNIIQSFEIADNTDESVTINISGATNNDLGNALQGVCEILVEFSHDAISDIVLELISPSGQSVQLIGDISGSGPTTLNSNWNVSFVQCGTASAPDAGIDAIWDNSSAWANFGSYTGSYYPYSGCLEDFNSGPVNGNWELRIIDGSIFNEGTLIDFSLVFCDDSGISCAQCNANAGSFSNLNPPAICENEAISPDLGLNGQNADPEYTYLYLITQANQIVRYYDQALFTDLDPGSYQVCGISIQPENINQLLGLDLDYPSLINSIVDGSLPFCIDITRLCSTIEVLEAAEPIVIFEEICEGEVFNYQGNNYTNSGLYEATKPGTGRCDTAVIINLDVIELDPVITPSATEISCTNAEIILDASNSLQDDYSSFIWSTTNGNILENFEGNEIKINRAGTYTLQQEEKGCFASTSITITENVSVPDVNITSGALACNQEEVRLNINSSATIVSALWQGPLGYESNDLEPFVSLPGIYYAQFLDDTGCTINTEYSLEQQAGIANIQLSAGEISCSDPFVRINTDSDIPLVDFEWEGPNGFVSGDEAPLASEVGEYYLTAIDENGCRAYASIVIHGHPQEFEYELYANDFICLGGTTEIGVMTDVSEPIYNWSGPGNFFSSDSIVNVRLIGKYYVEIISGGCTVRDSIEVDRDVSNLPDYTIEIDTIGDCENPLYRLRAVPISGEFQVSRLRWDLIGAAYLGDGSEMFVTEVGTYRLIGYTYTGCTVVRFLDIEPEPGAPMVSLDEKNIVNCYSGLGNGSITLNGDPSYDYNWEGPNSFASSDKDIFNLDPGTYFLTVTDPVSSCKSFFRESINLDTLRRSISIDHTNINCNNTLAQINLNLGGGIDSLSWTGPNGFSGNLRNFSVADIGTYNVSVTWRNGCISEQDVEIIGDFELPSAMLIDTALNCSERSVQLTPLGVAPGYTYLWTGPEDYSSISFAPVVYEAGDYTLEITGANGCVDSFSVFVSSDPVLPQSIASVSDNLSCEQTIVSLMGNSNAPIIQYLWEGPNGYLSLDQNPIISNPGIYYLNVEDEQGCVGIDSVIVDQFIILPEFNVETPSISCLSQTESLIASSPDPGAIFIWNGPEINNISGDSISVTNSGTYTLLVTGSNQCTVFSEIEILPDTTDLSLFKTLNCDIRDLDLSDTVDYNINLSGQWTGPNGFTSDVLAPLVMEEGLYEGILQGDNGCLVNVLAEIVLDTLKPVATAMQLGTIKCEIQDFTLSGSGSSTGDFYQYSWSSLGNGAIIDGQDSLVAEANGSGNYLLEVIDIRNGCSELDSILVIEEENNLVFNTNISNPQCFGFNDGVVEIVDVSGGSGELEYSLDGVIFGSTNVFQGLASGNINVYVRDSFSCIATNSVEILEADRIELDLGNDIDVFLGDEITISANTNLSNDQIQMILWQLSSGSACADCLSFDFSPLEDTEVQLSIMDANGCEASDNIMIRVDQEPVLYKPNVFSPNEDGVNDLFYLFGNRGVSLINKLEIFDRWGNKVFANFNIVPGDSSYGWDGRHNGNYVQNGVYFYIAEVEMITGFKRNIRGDITVLK